jgi:hypothetical protein
VEQTRYWETQNWYCFVSTVNYLLCYRFLIQYYYIDPRFLDDGSEWSASRPDRFTPTERASSTHWIGWVGPRTGLDDMEKRKFLTLPGLELRPLSRPARSQSLYRLRYPGSFFSHHGWQKLEENGIKFKYERNKTLCLGSKYTSSTQNFDKMEYLLLTFGISICLGRQRGTENRHSPPWIF